MANDHDKDDAKTPDWWRKRADDNRVKQMKEDRSTSKEAAANAEYEDGKDYMKELGKEGIKRQQEKMRDTASSQDFEYREGKRLNAQKAKPSTFKKGGRVRATGMAKVHKGERVLTAKQAKAKTASRKRG